MEAGVRGEGERTLHFNTTHLHFQTHSSFTILSTVHHITIIFFNNISSIIPNDVSLWHREIMKKASSA